MGKSIADVCLCHGVSAEATSRVQHVANDLRDFETRHKGAMPTRRQQVRSLEEIEAHALAIRSAIGALDTATWMGLDAMLASDTPSPEGVRSADGFDGKLGGHVIYAQRMACNLATAARQAALHVKNAGGQVGRKNVLGSYAGFIAGIAVALKDSSIEIGRGGAFEKICDAVFEAAGVPAKAEGAIRYFTQNMLNQSEALRGILNERSRQAINGGSGARLHPD